MGGIVSFMIGGFLSTILAKEKEIQNGICTGVFILIIIIIVPLLSHKPIIIHGIGFIIYFVSAAIGGYMAILLVKHLKLSI